MVITKKSPLSILPHLRVVNSEFLKQRFDGCLFQVSFYLYSFFSLFTVYYRKLFSCACFCFENRDSVLFCLLLVSFYWCLSVSLPKFVTLTGLP